MSLARNDNSTPSNRDGGAATSTTAGLVNGERLLMRAEIRNSHDASTTRLRARQLAELAGLGTHEATTFAAAVSEVARNALAHATGAWAEFSLRDSGRPAVVARICDRGPGIPNVDAVLRRPAADGAAGLVAAKRLSDEFHIESASTEGTTTGTRVTIVRHLPSTGRSIDEERLASELSRITTPARGSFEETRDQNRELLQALDALRDRQAEVERLNAELAETNRGVLALYAELDEKAASLQRASTLKTRFLSDMTHELRTPLNAMISLSRLLLDRVDGDLTPEQERQVSLINKSATSLGEMVNDLLDIARIEAGKTDLHVGEFAVADALLALRGMFRPLLPEDGRVQLIVEDPAAGCPAMLFTDERKLSQILRNLISNALKFTERGEVRVRVMCGDSDGDTQMIRFCVSDTGIGIAPTDLPRLFHDFEQIDSPIQRRVRGTGLGLPLTRKLARLMGGDVTVESEPGIGSTFTLTIPSRMPRPVTAGDATGSKGEFYAG